jgi:hypothetical protein
LLGTFFDNRIRRTNGVSLQFRVFRGRHTTKPRSEQYQLTELRVRGIKPPIEDSKNDDSIETIPDAELARVV